MKPLPGRKATTSAKVGITVAAVVLLSSASVASASTMAAPRSSTQITANQATAALAMHAGKLASFGTWIATRPGISASGFVGSVDQASRDSKTILWHGPATPLLKEIQSEGARQGITVGVQYRKYSLAQLQAAAMYAFAHAGLLPGFKVADVADVSADYDGITINGSFDRNANATRTSQAALAATIATRTGVAARLVGGQSMFLTVASVGNRTMTSANTPNGTRTQDFSPFSAGGFMKSPHVGIACSSGFGIEINGKPRITTARHCDAGDFEDWGFARSKYGSKVTTSRNGAGRVLASRGFYSMFDGTHSTATVRNIAGFADLSIGDTVCTSGGNSGDHCGLRVSNLHVNINDGFGIVATIQANSAHGTIAAMEGDSGGPVFQAHSHRWWAAGMIQAGLHQISNCGSSNLPRACFSTVFFSSMRTIVNSIRGATLRTKR